MAEKTQEPSGDIRLISFTETCRMTSLSRSNIRLKAKAGLFPAMVEIGSRKAFVHAEVVAWIREQVEARRLVAA